MELNFDLLLNDKFTEKMKAAEAATAKLEERLNKINGMFDKANGAISKANGFGGGNSRNFDDMRHILRDFNSAVDKGISFLKGFATATVGIMRNVVEAGSKFSLTKTDISNLSQDPNLFNALKGYAGNSIYGTQIFKSAKSMLGYGFKSDEILPTVKAAGALAGGSEDKLNRILYALSELRAGDVSYRHVRQLNMAGVSGEMLTKYLGLKNIDQLREVTSKHLISGEKFSQALINMANDPNSIFYQREQKLLNMPAGRATQLKTNMELFWSELSEKILGSTGFKHFLDTMSKLFNSTSGFTDKLVKFGSDIFEAFTKIAEKLNSFVQNGGLDKLISVLGTIIDNFQEIATTLIGLKALRSLTSFASDASRLMDGSMLKSISALSIEVIPSILSSAVIVGAFVAFNKAVQMATSPDANAMGNISDLDTPFGRAKNRLHNFFTTGSFSLEQTDSDRAENERRYKMEQAIKTGVKDAAHYGFKTWSEFSNMETLQPELKAISESLQGTNFKQSEFNERLPELIKSVSENDKILGMISGGHVSDYMQAIRELYSNMSVSKSKTGKTGGANKTDLDSATVRGVQTKNIYINIHDGLINHLTNNYNSSPDRDPKVASDIENIVAEAILNGLRTGERMSQ